MFDFYSLPHEKDDNGSLRTLISGLYLIGQRITEILHSILPFKTQKDNQATQYDSPNQCSHHNQGQVHCICKRNIN